MAVSSALACVARPWDVGDLERRYPALGRIGSHRLGDASPYLLPLQGVLTLFLCRWPTENPIPVSLPPGADRHQVRAVEKALRAWEGAGLGVRFAPGAAPGAGIEIRLVGAEEVEAQAANTIAECAVDPAGLEPSSRGVIPARLVFASVHMARSGRDLLDREVALSDEEFLGGVIHELGHALGFQGHAKRGDTVMVRSVDHVRRAGRRVLAGKPWRDHTLRSLYAVPSGTVVRRMAISKVQTAPLDRMARIARLRGFAGPFVRVGDRAARISWLDTEGRPYALHVFEPASAVRAPSELVIDPSSRTANLLGEG